MGRPRKEINWQEFDKLCAMQCTKVEICSWFQVDEKTVSARVREEYGCSFSEIYREKRGVGKIALRRAQYNCAIAGNATLQIWLGKQYLNQSDKQQTEQMQITQTLEQYLRQQEKQKLLEE